MNGVRINRTVKGGAQVPAIEFGERLELDTTQSARRIYQVSEGRKAKIGALILTNVNQSSTAQVSLYDSTSTVSNRILELILGPYKSEVLIPDDLIGVKEALSSFDGKATVSGVFVHIGGYETPG